MPRTRDLLRFDQKLRELTDEASEARPFLCDGPPSGCEVFLVGVNPGKSSDFWTHWNVNTGCDKRAWLRDYLATHGRYSPTRKRIEILFESLAPLRCLETNVFPHPSPRESALPISQRDTRIFEFLLETIRPRIVFAHGKSAVKHLAKLTQTDLFHGRFTTVTYRDSTVDIIVGHHLSYQWSFASVEQLGKQLVARYRSLDS